jgi:hypothetical protein
MRINSEWCSIFSVYTMLSNYDADVIFNVTIVPSVFMQPTCSLQSSRNVAMHCSARLLNGVQSSYCTPPLVAHLQASNIKSSIDSTQEEKPIDIKLWLPSQIRRETLLPCNDSFSKHKWDLWHAQAFDALDDLCWHLRL